MLYYLNEHIIWKVVVKYARPNNRKTDHIALQYRQHRYLHHVMDGGDRPTWSLSCTINVQCQWFCAFSTIMCIICVMLWTLLRTCDSFIETVVQWRQMKIIISIPFEGTERKTFAVENVVEKTKYLTILFFSRHYTHVDPCRKISSTFGRSPSTRFHGDTRAQSIDTSLIWSYSGVPLSRTLYTHARTTARIATQTTPWCVARSGCNLRGSIALRNRNWCQQDVSHNQTSCHNLWRLLRESSVSHSATGK